MVMGQETNQESSAWGLRTDFSEEVTYSAQSHEKKLAFRREGDHDGRAQNPPQ